jgi:hypothetical protein
MCASLEHWIEGYSLAKALLYVGFGRFERRAHHAPKRVRHRRELGGIVLGGLLPKLRIGEVNVIGSFAGRECRAFEFKAPSLSDIGLQTLNNGRIPGPGTLSAKDRAVPDSE